MRWVLIAVGVAAMVPLTMLAVHFVRTEFGRQVLSALAGYRCERDEVRLRHPSARVNDIADVTDDLGDQPHPAPGNYPDERVVLRDLALHSFTPAEARLMRELSKDLTRPRRLR